MELTAVLVLLAIAAAAVALRLYGPMRQMQLRDVADRIVQFDRLTRAYARQNDKPLVIVFDLAKGQLRRTDTAASGVGTPLQLPEGYRLARLLIGDQEIQTGSAALACGRRGLTRSYAMMIEDSLRQQQWILLAGLTGEVVQFGVTDEKTVRDIIAATASGHNAG